MKIGPSRENQLRYAKTYAMYLVPLAIIFGAAWLFFLSYLVSGVAHGRGDQIINGLFLSVGGAIAARLSWRNARQSVRDYRSRHPRERR